MELTEVLTKLESAGTEQNRKVYARHGAREPFFGASFGVLNGLQKQIKRNHALALELWATGNYDAMILALKIADPEALSAEEAEAWAWGAYNYVLANELAGLLLKSPLAEAKAGEWVEADGEYVERAGWLILAGLADQGLLTDDFFRAALTTIEQNIHACKNRVRDAMNTAVINIGLRPTLTDEAIAVADRIGPLEVDHGETDCKTPPAVEYIYKTLAYRARKVQGWVQE